MALLKPPRAVQLFVASRCPGCWPYFVESFSTARVDGSVTFTSWYRTAASNAAAGGQPRSQHLDGVALDFVGDGARQLAAHLTARGWTVIDEGDHFHAQIFPSNPFR